MTRFRFIALLGLWLLCYVFVWFGWLVASVACLLGFFSHASNHAAAMHAPSNTQLHAQPEVQPTDHANIHPPILQPSIHGRTKHPAIHPFSHLSSLHPSIHPSGHPSIIHPSSNKAGTRRLLHQNHCIEHLFCDIKDTVNEDGGQCFSHGGTCRPPQFSEAVCLAASSYHCFAVQ